MRARSIRRQKTDRRAVGYERDGLAQFLASLRHAALAELCVTAQDCFLDVGCATGAAVRAVAETTPLAVGVDLSEPMIRHARQCASAMPCHYLMADARRLPFADESFTATLCTSVMTYVDTPTDVVAELWRVTKPHGRIVLGYLDVLGDVDSGPNVRRLSLHTALGRYKIVVIDRKNNHQSRRH